MGKYALIIGNSEYQEPKLAQLVKPGQDARGLADVLLEKEIGGFDEVKLLVNEPEVVVRRAISRFFAQKNRHDLLLLYFSGHGVLDDEGQLYFAVRDTEHDALTSTAIAAGFVRQEMNRSLSRRQVLILDCCNSGSFGKGAKGVGESVGAAAAFEVTGYGRAVLTATDSIQYAWEKEQFVGNAEYSVFTHFLIEGLKTGAADNEGDADGQTALDELFDYARTQIRAANAKQTPTLSIDKLTDPIIIARNPRPLAPKPLELPAELRQLIESPFASARESAVRELEKFLNGSVPGLALAAHAALEKLIEDDSRRVAVVASAALKAYAEAQQPKAQVPPDIEALATQAAEADRIAREMAEQERLAVEKAKQEAMARERAERLAALDAQRTAREQPRPPSEFEKLLQSLSRRWALALIGAAILLLALAVVVANLWPDLPLSTATPPSATFSVATTQVPAQTDAPPPTEAPRPTAPSVPTPTEEPFTPHPVYSAPDCSYGGAFKSMEAVDRYTVRFTLCNPDVALLSKLALPAFAIYSTDYLTSTGGTGQLLLQPIGTGPYVLNEWQVGDHLTLVRNPNYWGEPAKTGTISVRWEPDAAKRQLRLQSGEADGIDDVDANGIATLSNDATVRLMPRAGTNIFYIGFSNTISPFDNVRVRQALAYGIDRQRIVESYFDGTGEVATHFVPCIIPGGCEGEAWYAHDPEAAKALLAEAGYPDGFEITLTLRDVVRGYLSQPNEVAADIQAQLADLGIRVTPNVMESGEFLLSANTGQIGFYLLGFSADYPDTRRFLDFHFGSDANMFGKPYGDIQQALNRAAGTVDLVSRNLAYAEANNLIRQHVPMIPVAHNGSMIAYLTRVEGAHANPSEDERFAALSVTGQTELNWLQDTEPASLYCADETDDDSWRICSQINETLVRYEIGSAAVEPVLAVSWEINSDLTTWTFNLRRGVQFHDGTAFDANDVLVSFSIQWDADHKFHIGNSGGFDYWQSTFGSFLNAP